MKTTLNIFFALVILWLAAGTPRFSYHHGMYWYCRHPNLFEIVGLMSFPGGCPQDRFITVRNASYRP